MNAEATTRMKEVDTGRGSDQEIIAALQLQVSQLRGEKATLKENLDQAELPKAQQNLQQANEEGNNFSNCQNNNPSFPSNIVCQRITLAGRTKHNCYRQCSRSHKIVYTFPHAAGLSDRMAILNYLTGFAGYLCATVYWLSPAVVLDVKAHNQGQPLDASLDWSDFFNFQFYNNSRRTVVSTDALRQQQIIAEADPSKVVVTTTPAQIVGHFHQVTSLSLDTDDDFVWVIAFNWYELKDPLLWYLEHTQNNKNNENQSFCFPIANWDHLYSYNTLPSQLENIVVTLWKTIPKNDSTVVGSWHIRRNDAISVCDTSLERMERFITCTFANTDKNITLLFYSDERDPAYRQGIVNLFHKHFPHTVQVISLDKLVEDYLRNSNTTSAYYNNFHVFELEHLLATHDGTAFQLSHRRTIDCSDCVDLPQFA